VTLKPSPVTEPNQIFARLRPAIRRIWWPSARWLLRQVRRWEQQPLARRRIGLVVASACLLALLAGSIGYRTSGLARHWLPDSLNVSVSTQKPAQYGNPYPTIGRNAPPKRP
jgi:hypothetical protein